MRHRVSITLDEQTVLAIQDKLRVSSRSGIFRNKSHFIECTIKKYLGENNGR
ncbi:MAG: hypothetical protein U9O94_10190 [Nanoarchaeota archaeon]|nr:hypothetical protein [Nanoarchaeota archaeon]